MNDCITYVALDAHKKDHKVAALLPGCKEPEQWTVRNVPREIQRMVRRICRRAGGPVEFCYEAGVCGFALQRQILAAGDEVKCRVVAPSLIPIRPGSRIKTDRRDARKLVELLRAGLLTEVYPPNPQQEAVRDLCRCREAAKADLLRARHRLSKFLLRRGMVYHEGGHWTQRHFAWLRRLRFDEPLDREIFGEYVAELDHRVRRVEALDRRLEEVSQEQPYQEPVGWLRCFRGIDTVTALMIVAELYSFGRFRSPRQLMSYLGLVPWEFSSGDAEHRGGITKAGNRRVRRLLIEAGWHQRNVPVTSKALRKRREGQPAWVVAIAERAQKRLYQRYWRLVHRGKAPVKAVTAVARELSGFIWSVLFPPSVGASAGEDGSALRAAGEGPGRARASAGERVSTPPPAFALGAGRGRREMPVRRSPSEGKCEDPRGPASRQAGNVGKGRQSPREFFCS